MFSPLTWPDSRKHRAIFFRPGTNGNLIRFGGKGSRGSMPMPGTARNPDPETSDKKYLQTTIGDLRKLYGANFAKGCADNESIADVVLKQPSLMTVIRHHEKKWFEKI